MTAPEDLPIASEDAIDHWKRITDSPGYGPVVAWSEAQRRNVPHLSGDEIRHHHQTDTLLLASAVTLWGISWAIRIPPVAGP